ncbi:hypothetical protein H4S02_001040 [Coemansia sp. RSA 2611]|nr:hypothetical protein IWW54_000572 [Coemansia sp. RSA 2705]KAJ2318428.1 hypothetical protein IWW52_002567 [Coemansia sp. RSA 2704]KAJ2391958.1 hypothetical protein H4S02_001040 [Coemansia sp. RSA 2611]
MGRFNLATQRGGQPRPRRTQLVLSYAPDYAVLVVMAILWGLLSKVKPFHRDFSLTDKTIQYPYKPDSVPFYAAVLLCLVFPLVVIALWAGAVRRSFHDLNSGILGLCMALVLNMMITNTVKNLAGRLRPDFISRCNLDIDTVKEPAIGLLTSAVCRPQDDSVFDDGMRSFPSGHTSFSFAGLTFLSLWLAGHQHIGDRRGRTYKSFVCLVPLVAAMLVGVSRTKDYRHHWQDVLGGAILGFLMGWFGYLQYYPSPWTRHVDDPSMPHPTRIPEEPAERSFVMKSFTHAAGDAPVNPGPYGRNTAASSTNRLAADTSGVGANYSPDQGVSSGSVYSQHYGPHVAVRVPEQTHGMQSHESLAG